MESSPDALAFYRRDAAEAISRLTREWSRRAADSEVRCFLLTLPIDENLRRIERRQQARAIDERAFEQGTVIEEREAFARSSDLGEPLDVSAPPSEVVATILSRLTLP
jgi:hypothetical protein